MKAPNSVFLCRYKMLYREIQNKSLQLFHIVKKCLIVTLCYKNKKKHTKNPPNNIQYTGSMIKKMILKKIQIPYTVS